MSQLIENSREGYGLTIGIVVSQFNDYITHKLLKGAEETLLNHGVASESITVVKVPGAFEIPIVAMKMASTKKYNAIICLGAVIKGDTDHYEHVSTAVTNGISKISLDFGIPIIFGVLTTHNIEQALDRSGGKKGNEGESFAIAALETINVIKQI
jgi:6,7-dimethyl-8-ribityllumazine synthase